LGKHSRPDEVVVIWPDGSRQLVADVNVGRLTKVKKEKVEEDVSSKTNSSRTNLPVKKRPSPANP
jgi:hypothetical protein